jgi:hypothetical protein
VKVLRAPDGADVERPYEINLWEVSSPQGTAIDAPLDPALYGIDPLSYLQ